MNPVNVIGYVLLGVFVLAAIITMNQAQARLEDPRNANVIYLEQLPTVALLAGTGIWLVRIYRQSGNVHSQTEVAGTAAAALNVAIATFRRAKIDAVGVRENSDSRLAFGRLFHNHRGSNEGKKVGSAEIFRLN